MAFEFIIRPALFEYNSFALMLTKHTYDLEGCSPRPCDLMGSQTLAEFF
jgi:hypothetical protein